MAPDHRDAPESYRVVRPHEPGAPARHVAEFSGFTDEGAQVLDPVV